VQSHLEAENRTNLLIIICGEDLDLFPKIFVLISFCIFCILLLLLYIKTTGTSWMIKEIV
jgi:hypothetical protein